MVSPTLPQRIAVSPNLLETLTNKARNYLVLCFCYVVYTTRGGLTGLCRSNHVCATYRKRVGHRVPVVDFRETDRQTEYRRSVNSPPAPIGSRCSTWSLTWEPGWCRICCYYGQCSSGSACNRSPHAPVNRKHDFMSNVLKANMGLSL